jgi:hypothetical protein
LSRLTPVSKALLVLLLVVSGAAVAHPGRGGHHGPPPPPPVAAEEQRAYDQARGAFDRHCGRCHTTGGKRGRRRSLEQFNMDSYPFTGEHAADAGDAVRTVLGAGREPPSMPKDNPGLVRGADLQVILAWANAFERARGIRQAGNAPGRAGPAAPGTSGRRP